MWTRMGAVSRESVLATHGESPLECVWRGHRGELHSNLHKRDSCHVLTSCDWRCHTGVAPRAAMSDDGFRQGNAACIQMSRVI